MATPNAELAYLVLDHIDAHPDQHDQGVWLYARECGTEGCFAGWATVLSGDEPLGFGWQERVRSAETHRVRTIRTRARDLLGITDRQADSLFGGDNSRPDIAAIVAGIFGPRPEPTA